MPNINKSIEELTGEFSRISINMPNNIETNMNEQFKVILEKFDRIELAYREQSERLEEKSKKLENIEIFLRKEYENKPVPALEPVYEDQYPRQFSGRDLSTKVIESLPQFKGDPSNYQTWRSQVTTAFKKFEGNEGSENYWDALCLLRSKITDEASNMLTSHNTKMNFKGILRRLDLTYGNRKPIEVLEFELQNLKQGNLELSKFYQLVNEKRTEIVNKYLAVYGDESEYFRVMSVKTSENAHRTFLAGLKRNIRDHVVDRKTRTLEDAYAEAQVVVNEFDEAGIYTDRYQETVPKTNYKNPKKTDNFEQKYIRTRNQMQNEQPNLYQQNYYSYKNHQPLRYQSQMPPKPISQQSKPTPMDIDPSVKQNYGKPTYQQYQYHQQPIKRFGSEQRSAQPQFKNMRLNYIDEPEEEGEEHYYEEISYNSEQFENDNEAQDYLEEHDLNILNQSFLKAKNNLIYFCRTDKNTNRSIRILVDTGSTGNFCREDSFDSKKHKLPNPIKINSIHGSSFVTDYYKIDLEGHKLNFLIIPHLTEQAILGLPGISTMKMKIFGEDNSIHYERKLNINKSHMLNFIIHDDVKEHHKKEINNLMQKTLDLGDHIPFNTNVIARIETKDDSPIYKKPIPLPPASNEIIRAEIEKLLKLNIIRPSTSPYNAPAFLVPKHDSKGNKTGDRLVIDYRSLNEVTKEFKFAMPNTSVILSNLGKSRYFTTLDIESGFHHILLRESDREKTAFSTNTGKYEFNRLPFGLKNAPSIFQCTINNILEEFIGKICYVYIDDVIIFSETEEQHMIDTRNIMQTLINANMKISSKKSKFFMKETEFLGYVVSYGSLKMDESKVKAIQEYPEPTTLKELRSFLGLSGYYRKFVKNYADITKPMTTLLRNHANVKITQSSKIKIKFDVKAKEAFKTIKDKIKEQVELYQPDYNKPFTLTTDASNVAIGAVLAQNERPVAFISRTLTNTEQNYAANEKEMLAIVWALQSLRNYLYGHTGFKIFTDHQPLTFALSDKNSNLKLKRWKSFIEEFSPQLIYKPGKENIVADALSRSCNILSDEETDNDEISTTAATCHSQEESTDPLNIPRTNVPLNTFKQQIIIERETYSRLDNEKIFEGFKRHLIFYDNLDNLKQNLKKIINPKIQNAIYCPEETFALLNQFLTNDYPTTKFVFCSKIVKDIFDKIVEDQIIKETHNRAHRSEKENYKQIINNYFFPRMKYKINQYVGECSVCKIAKYERHPQKQIIGETPIPSNAGEIIQMDLFFVGNKIFITIIDKFSKYLITKQIPNKTEMSVQVLELLNHFPNAKILVTDREPAFLSASMNEILRLRNIEHFTPPSQHSVSNGQIERAHSTILEIMRCIQEHKGIIDRNILIMEAIKEYNDTIHSVTNAKPYEVFHRQTEF